MNPLLIEISVEQADDEYTKKLIDIYYYDDIGNSYYFYRSVNRLPSSYKSVPKWAASIKDVTKIGKLFYGT